MTQKGKLVNQFKPMGSLEINYEKYAVFNSIEPRDSSEA